MGVFLSGGRDLFNYVLWVARLQRSDHCTIVICICVCYDVFEYVCSSPSDRTGTVWSNGRVNEQMGTRGLSGETYDCPFVCCANGSSFTFLTIVCCRRSM